MIEGAPRATVERRRPRLHRHLASVALLAIIVTVASPEPATAKKVGAGSRGPAGDRAPRHPTTTSPAGASAAVSVEEGVPPATVPVPPRDGEPLVPPGAGGAVVLEGGMSVEISAGQRVTIAGDSPSLRAVIEEVCRQAGIQLRTYAAPDRRCSAHLERVPVADALRSMLRTESYLVGFRAEQDSRQGRVTWLRVLGATGTGSTSIPRTASAAPQPAPVAAPPGPASQFVISSSLLFQAFGTFDPKRREQAQQEILTRISDPEQLSRFLATDPKELAKMFNRYRDSAVTLRRLQSLAERPEIQAKFDEILAAIGQPQ
jgi:hypothetical protein